MALFLQPFGDLSDGSPIYALVKDLRWPGRQVFDDLIDQIERGEWSGLCW